MYLSYLLKTSSTSIPETLNNLGLNLKQCGKYTLWGGCGDHNCTLTHNDTPLSPEQLSILTAILTDSTAKLPAIKTEK